MDRRPTETGKQVARLSDVARLAGVSTATASKALNGRAQVHAETRGRVHAAAEALGFTPNPFAKALNETRTGTIGMLTSDLETRFVLPVLLGAEDAFGEGATSVLLCDARGDSIRETHHLKTLLARRVDGIVIVGRTTNARPSISAGVPVPVVYAYAPSESEEDSSFTPDNYMAGQLAVEHLIARGRKSIALVNGEPNYDAATDRAAGARDAMAVHGLELQGGDALYGEWAEGWGRRGVASLLASGRKIDGLIAGSDQIGRGAVDQLRESGLDVPSDVAVVGMDNWEVLAATARPPLTSIDMMLQALGRAAALALAGAIDGNPQPGVHRLPVRVVPRDSTASVN